MRLMRKYTKWSMRIHTKHSRYRNTTAQQHTASYSTEHINLRDVETRLFECFILHCTDSSERTQPPATVHALVSSSPLFLINIMRCGGPWEATLTGPVNIITSRSGRVKTMAFPVTDWMALFTVHLCSTQAWRWTSPFVAA